MHILRELSQRSDVALATVHRSAMQNLSHVKAFYILHEAVMLEKNTELVS